MTEYDDHHPTIEGSIPEWFSGTLIRNGPGLFEAGKQRVNHWFDGLAMLRQYAFKNGELRYSNRFLRTEAYADAMAGRLTGQFSTMIESYRQHIELAESLGDYATGHMLREQLITIEEHAHHIEHYLEDDTLVVDSASN